MRSRLDRPANKAQRQHCARHRHQSGRSCCDLLPQPNHRREIYRNPKMSYPGGKGASGTVQQIINCIPPVKTIASVFGGNCALLRTIRPAEISFFIDADHSAVQNFSAWRDAAGRKEIMCICGDALAWLEELRDQRLDDGNGMFVYCDPPYLPSTLSRPDHSLRNGQRYAHKFGVECHEKLLSLITKLKCYVMISGYRSAMYDRTLQEPTWWRKDFPAMTHGGVRTESIWMNYNPTMLTSLHDYRFLGNTFREREVWKKRRQTIERKFSKLSALEKRAMLEHLGKSI